MDIRQLSDIYTEQFRSCRLEALSRESESFGSSFEEENEYSDAKFSSILEMSEGRMVLGCFVNNSLVGTVGIGRSRRVKTMHKCFFWGMYVNAENRGFGIARALTTEAIARVRQVDIVTQLNLSVVETNKAAISLYESLGFIEYGREPNALAVGKCKIDELLMYKAMN